MCHPPNRASRKKGAYGLSQPSGSEVSVRAVGHTSSAYLVICKRAPASAPPARERDAQIKAWNTFPQEHPASSSGLERRLLGERVILSERRVQPVPRGLVDGGHVLTELPRGRRFELALRDLVEERSEERRVGKEWRSRGWRGQSQGR